MRSRYSAFCQNDAEYLFATLHPSKRTSQTVAQLTASNQETEWLNLRILKHSPDQPRDNEGIVEFVASYKNAKDASFLYERSFFLRDKGQWFYVEGEIMDPASISLKRNEICWCGSKKKF